MLRQLFFLFLLIAGYIYSQYSEEDDNFKEENPFSEYLKTNLKSLYEAARTAIEKLTVS